jgi:hypothetical protein
MVSRCFRAGGFVAVALLFVAAAAAKPQSVLSNADVMEMVHGGLSESVVIAKIRTTPGAYDLSTKALLDLKRAGVSDAIVEAMVSSDKKGAEGNPKTARSTSRAATSSGEAVKAINDGALDNIRLFALVLEGVPTSWWS